MPLQSNGSAPYAPPAAIISIIERARARGLPTPVTKDVLGRAGVAESLIPRTLQSLQLLELINEDGTWTQNLEILRRVPENEFRSRLAEIIRSVYAEVFQFADPAKDSTTAVRDAFRTFTPHGQQDRMVTLFLGLCQNSGIIDAGGQPKSAQREKRVVKKPLPLKPVAKSKQNEQTTGCSRGDNIELPPALTGLLTTLPKSGSGWTQEDRIRFLKAFEAMLDYSIPIRSIEQDENTEDL